MKNSKERFDYISEYLLNYEKKISLLNKLGLTDEAKHFENFAKEIGELWFGQKLLNLNSIVPNCPYFDLVTEDEKIFVQVSTAQDIFSKIKLTLNRIKDSKNEKIKTLTSVKFFMLNNASVDKVHDLIGNEQIGNIAFKASTDLITTKTILEKCLTDLDFQIAFYNLVKKDDDNSIKIRIEELEQNFREFCAITNPNLNVDIMLCSNMDKVGSFLEAIKNNGIICIYSPVGKEHGYCFLKAAILQSEDKNLIENTFIIKDKVALKWVEANLNNKIIIVEFDDNFDKCYLHNNKYLFVKVMEYGGADISLSNVFLSDFEKGLESMGVSPSDSYDMAQKVNRNISCLKRKLAVDSIYKIPHWADNDNKYDIIPIAVLSEINVNDEFDKKVVEKITGLSFEKYISELEKWLKVEDSPIFKVTNVYRVYSKEEALGVLGVKFDDCILKKAESILQKVFDETDPIFDKNIDRWNVRDVNEVFKYNEHIIRGILDTFAIMSNDQASQQHYDMFVTELFKKITKTTKSMHTFSKYFSILSEISATYTLRSFENLLISNNSIFSEFAMQNYGANSFMQQNDLIYVVSMLERCLLRPEVAKFALSILLRIYYRNYDNSLKEQFSRDIPQYFSILGCKISALKVEDIIAVFNVISKDRPEELVSKVARNMLYGNQGGIFSCTYPKWKSITKYEVPTLREAYEMEDVAIDWLCSNTNNKVNAFSIIINIQNYYISPLLRLDKIIKEIKSKMLVRANDEEMRLINVATIKILSAYKKNNRSNDDYAKKYELLKQLYEFTLPNDLFERYRYIFESNAYEIPVICDDEDSEFNWQKSLEIKKQIVNTAINKLIEKFGINVIDRIIKITNDNNSVVWDELFHFTEDKVKTMASFLQLNKNLAFINYLWKVSLNEDIKDMINKIVDPIQRKTIIYNLPENQEIFEFIENKSYEQEYWELHEYAYFRSIELDQDLREYIFNKMLKYCPANLLLDYEKELDYEQCMLIFRRIVDCVLSGIEVVNLHNHTHHLIGMLKKLDQKYYKNSELAEIEISLMSIWAGAHDEFEEGYPKAMQELFAQNPEIFCRFIKQCIDVSNQYKNLKTVGGKVFFDMIQPMGRKAFIPIDYIGTEIVAEKGFSFKQWFDYVINYIQSEDPKTKHILLIMLINMLAQYKAVDSNSIWPSTDIAIYLEICVSQYESYLLDNMSLKRDPQQAVAGIFACAYQNSNFGVRYVSTGEYESKLAEKFDNYSKYYIGLYPTVSLALSYIAESYRSQGNHDHDRAILGWE